MKSPFPGMDPYLEQWWRDVHHSLCTYSRDALQPQLGPDMRARIDERLVVESDDLSRSIYPDLRVIEHGRSPGGAVSAAEGVAVAEPLLLRMVPEPAKEGFIEIIDARHGGRVITVIEFISPANKTGDEARKQYLQKQQECREAGVNLVEVELVRAGQRATLARLHRDPKLETPYQVCVFRASESNRLEVYPVSFRMPLPAIRVPLRTTDKDAILHLQSLIEQVYRNGAYGSDIDYSRPCDPPLSAEDAAWVQELLKDTRR